MEFDYNFRKCYVCNGKVEYPTYSTFGKCLNGCSEYEIDPQGGDASVTLFGDHNSENTNFCLPLYKHYSYKRDQEIIDYHAEELDNFINAIAYWKENDRYLAMILGDK